MSGVTLQRMLYFFVKLITFHYRNYISFVKSDTCENHIQDHSKKNLAKLTFTNLVLM